MKYPITLSVIIRGHNNKDLVMGLIQSIKDNIHRFSYEIIYVDNGSNDGSVSAIKKHFNNVVVISNDQNLGPCKATNQGLRRAKGEILVIFDSDTKVMNTLDGIIDYMLTTPGCAAATGRILNHDGSEQNNAGIFPSLKHAFFVSLIHLGLGRFLKNSKPIREYYKRDFDRNKTSVVDRIGLCAFFIKAQAFKVIGEQDERMVMYFEDVDWCYRLKKNKLDIHYYPDSYIVHYGGQTTSAKNRSWEMYKTYQTSLKVFCKKHIFPQHNFVFNLAIKFLIELRYLFIFISRIFFRQKFVGGAGYKKTSSTSKEYDKKSTGR